MLLAIYFGMPAQQARQMVEQQPDVAEAQLQQIPRQVIQTIQSRPAQQITQPQAQQLYQAPQIQQPAPEAAPQPEPQAEQPRQSNSLISFEEMAEFVSDNEGFEPYSYQDTPTNRSIGFGFNLNRPDARQLIENLGHNFQAVHDGSEAITRSDADSLRNHVIKEAYDIANEFSGGLNNLHPTAQKVIIDMAYNMGGPRLRGFKELQKALRQQDYNWAAEEMMDSRWFRENQTGNRDNMLVEMMQSISP